MRLRAAVPLVVAAACGGDRSRTAACGLAQWAGPSLILQRLTAAPYVLTDPPRGLPDSLPARIVGAATQGHVIVAYAGGRLTMGYVGESFPVGSVSDTTAYGLLVVDDSTQRAQGVLVYESRRPPPSYPQLGTFTGADRTIPLYGVRVDWSGVNNARCPLLGVAPAAAPPAQPPRPAR